MVKTFHCLSESGGFVNITYMANQLVPGRGFLFIGDMLVERNVQGIEDAKWFIRSWGATIID